MTIKEQVLYMLEAVPAPPDTLLDTLILQAQALICGYLMVDSAPAGTDPAAAQLAVVLFNRLGAEGEDKRIEGDITSFFASVPEHIRLMLRPFRYARAVGL